MEWAKAERAFAVKAYFSNDRSIITTQCAFHTRSNIAPHGRFSGQQSIVSWMNNFRKTGNVKEKNQGPARTERSPQTIDLLRLSVLWSRTRPARKHTAAVGLSNRSVRRILHEELKFHPYKLSVVQELNPRDFATWENACEALLCMPHDTIVFFSDEALVHLSGRVNRENMSYWSPNNPRQLHQRPLHSPRVTVWCALSRVRIIYWSMIFEENEQTV